jgi:hypothetical protein
MALPTTNLTLHLDASDTDKLFTTWVNGGSHTGTPGDGDAVQAWSRETDGSVTPCHAAYTQAGREPVWRTNTPLMMLPCLDFDGTDDTMVFVNNTDTTTYLGCDYFFGDQAKTIIGAIWLEAATSTQAAAQDNDAIFGGSTSFGLFAKNDGGQRKLLWTSYDGAWGDVAEQNVSTGTTIVFCARHDTSNLYLSVDGGSDNTVASGATGLWPPGQMRIGRAAGDVSNINGRIGELAFYNACLTGTDLTDAIAYFRLKWQGVGGSTPTARIVTPYAAVTF